ncbi:HNH endonuclease [Mycobacterium sp. 852002-51163_SCH5372311]|uniref:HNH endonuclease n=1 Tax=Mycobacterium sp. 852002-51163_SCH5372311 TaxID=1834097 RepID=UPI0009EF5125|nr:HNH endonuclease [Mycobacterium sp. 852002-51163_SCH5372311]
MPRAPRLCPGNNSTCTNLIDPGQKYCDDCQPQHWRGPRTASSKVTSTRAWKRLRRQVLERDRYQCQTRGPYCTGHATQVDHIINTAAGGPPLDPNNCQAICQPCNTRKASAEGAAARAQRKAQRPTPLHPGILR